MSSLAAYIYYYYLSFCYRSALSWWLIVSAIIYFDYYYLFVHLYVHSVHINNMHESAIALAYSVGSSGSIMNIVRLKQRRTTTTEHLRHIPYILWFCQTAKNAKTHSKTSRQFVSLHSFIFPNTRLHAWLLTTTDVLCMYDDSGLPAQHKPRILIAYFLQLFGQKSNHFVAGISSSNNNKTPLKLLV